MWRRRELASEVMTSRQPTIDTDICLPTDLVATFLDRIHARLPALDADAETISVAHLGDGNVHFTVYPSDPSPEHSDRVIEAVEDEVQALGGSFSAEHGVGLSKLASMKRRKDPVALDVMRAVKAALDPDNRMNPGKVIPQ
jgi:FAD/FMN-containing dehydrogenase